MLQQPCEAFFYSAMPPFDTEIIIFFMDPVCEFSKYSAVVQCDLEQYSGTAP